MIAYLNGTVEDTGDGSLVLDVGGIGYLISISSRDEMALPPKGERLKIHTYMNVREDAVQLFGFLSGEDLAMFRLLISVSGIGPKVALGILSALTADDIRFAVLADDVKTLGKAPGIGNKTARKMILELKDKINFEEAVERKLDGGQMAVSAREEAVQALVALGYSGSDAMRAVRAVEITEDMDTEKILKLALRRMI